MARWKPLTFNTDTTDKIIRIWAGDRYVYVFPTTESEARNG